MHRHRCWHCRDDWEHDATDEGCVGVEMRTCPECEDGHEPDPWFVGQRPLGAPID